MIYWDCPYIFFHISTVINGMIDSDWWVYHTSCKVVNHDQAISRYETWKEQSRRKSLLLDFFGIHMGSFKNQYTIDIYVYLKYSCWVLQWLSTHKGNNPSIIAIIWLSDWHKIHFNDAQYIFPRLYICEIAVHVDPEYVFI